MPGTAWRVSSRWLFALITTNRKTAAALSTRYMRPFTRFSWAVWLKSRPATSRLNGSKTVLLLISPIRTSKPETRRASQLTRTSICDAFSRQLPAHRLRGFLNNLRIEYACRLLHAGGEPPIAEVAYACGFADPLYFSRYFRLKTGMSPRQYSAQNGLKTAVPLDIPW